MKMATGHHGGSMPVLSLVLVMALYSDGRAHAPSPAPSPAAGSSGVASPRAPGPPDGPTDCTATITGSLYSCRSYVEAGSNMTRPEKGCCRGFAAVVDRRPMCLCPLFFSGSDVYRGIQLDRTKSLMLPTACGVQMPPASLCTVIGSPVDGPASSTAAAPMGAATPPPPAAAGPPAWLPTGDAADLSFRSYALSLLAALSFAPLALP